VDLMALASRSRPSLRLLIGSHTRIYRVTSGLIGHRFPGAPPMRLLDHVGAKSGVKRTTPLVYLDDDHRRPVRVARGPVRARLHSYRDALEGEPDTAILGSRRLSGVALTPTVGR